MPFIETQFQDAVKKASIVSIANTKGIITYVNENFIQISGYPEHELIGQNHRIINSGYHQKSFWIDMWQTISSGKIWRNEVRNRARNGSIYWVDTHIIPFFDQDGKITEYLSIRNDITARKAAEEEISKLSDIVKFTINAVIITNKKGLITWVNEGFERTTGYTLQEISGKKPGDFLQGPDTDKATIKFMSDKLLNSDGFRVDILNYNKAGVKYWMDIDVRPIIHDGVITGFMAIQANITEKKEYELKLKESEERFSLAIDAANLGVWDWSIESDTNITNKRWFEILGYNEGEIDNTVETLQKLVHPSDLAIFQNSIHEHISGKKDFLEVEYRIKHKSGKYKWIYSRGKLVESNSDNNNHRILGTNQDINERKIADSKILESEARFRHVADSAPVLIWMSGIDKKIIYFNKTWLLFTGRKQEDELGYGWIRGVHENDKEFCIKIYNDSFDQKVAFTMSIRLRNKDNIYRWVMVNGVPREDNEGVFLGFIGSCIDITETKEITGKLEANQSELQRLLDEKDLLIKEIHHRVKNNLQMVSSVLFLKAQSLEDTVSKNILLETRTRIRSMAIIHERLMQSGGQITKVDTHDYIISLIEELKQINYYPESEIHYETEIDHHLMNLEQVVNIGFIVNEIVTNTVKHAFPNNEKGIISIAFKVFGNYLELNISDNGIGLPHYKLSDNTELFGIELIKVFTKNLKGHLFVETEKGTTWTVRLDNSLEQSH